MPCDTGVEEYVATFSRHNIVRLDVTVNYLPAPKFFDGYTDVTDKS